MFRQCLYVFYNFSKLRWHWHLKIFLRMTKSYFHDDFIKWKHFPRCWSFVRGIHRSLVNFPHKGQWRRALMFSLICAWTNGWANSWDAVDLRCNHAHYDIIVMFLQWSISLLLMVWLLEDASASAEPPWYWLRYPWIVWFRYKKCKLICPWTKWPPFHRQYFQMHFQEWKVLYFD